jgi:pimeloyl-ACP methyl ester carboxylesterase
MRERQERQGVGSKTRTFVLLHGAWHGGWCWERVAVLLRSRRHRVTTPTQTGLGCRAHLMAPDIDIAVFTADIVDHLRHEDLDDVVLVGHSFGGNAISGAAEQVPERIARLVYLDAMIPISGQSPFDELPPEAANRRIRIAEETSGGLSIPPPKANAFGISDPADAAWLEARLTPHPLRTFTSSQLFRNQPGNDLPAEYILCNDPIYGPLKSARAKARALGWPVREIATGHDAMVIAPEALVDMLETEPKR